MSKRHILLAAVLFAAPVPAWAQDPAKPESSQAQQPSQTSSADNAQTAGTKQQGSSSATVNVSESDARRVLSETLNAALTKGQLKSLNQQFAQADQQRLGDLSQQAQQLDAGLDQLRQAYKDKFQKDLDLSQNADQIFTAQFFQIGGGTGDQASAASASQSPDSSSTASNSAGTASSSDRTSTNADSARTASAGTSGTSGASASDTSSASAGTSSKSGTGTGTSSSSTGGTGASASGTASADQAQTAGSSSGASSSSQMTSLTIPKSHGIESTSVKLIQEGGQWKIDLPDSVDGKQLAQNLQKHVDMAVQQKDQWGSDASEAQRAIAHHVLMAFADNSSTGTSGQSGSSSSGSTNSSNSSSSDSSTSPQR